MEETVNKKVRNATTVSYDGVDFKSKLELYCYKRLKEENLQFDYEKYAFVLQDKFYATTPSIELTKSKGERKFDEVSTLVREITYKPDFVSLEGGWVIECKGFANDNFNLKWKMFKHFLYKNDMKVTLYVPRNQKQIDQVIEMIKYGTK